MNGKDALAWKSSEMVPFFVQVIFHGTFSNGLHPLYVNIPCSYAPPQEGLFLWKGLLCENLYGGSYQRLTSFSQAIGSLRLGILSSQDVIRGWDWPKAFSHGLGFGIFFLFFSFLGFFLYPLPQHILYILLLLIKNERIPPLSRTKSLTDPLQMPSRTSSLWIPPHFKW